MKSSVTWLERIPGWPLPHYCLCTSEAQFLAVMKYLKITAPPKWTHENKSGVTHHFTCKGKLTCVVCISVPKGTSKGQVYALLVHEAVHIWQEYCDDIGEKRPSQEFEAYTIQSISQCLMHSFDSVVMERNA